MRRVMRSKWAWIWAGLAVLVSCGGVVEERDGAGGAPGVGPKGPAEDLTIRRSDLGEHAKAEVPLLADDPRVRALLRKDQPRGRGIYLPCAAKACGEPCTACPRGDADCVETQLEKACNASGQCVAAPVACEEPAYAPCAGKACGQPCTVCPPGDPDCFETAVTKECDPSGACVAAPAVCLQPSYEPCAGKACGDSCTVCPPGDPDCVETAVAKECDASGACVAAPAECEEPPPAYDPCAGKVCGQQCRECAPLDEDCVETLAIKECNADGECVPAPAQCGPPADPCAGRRCGSPCTTCAHGDWPCLANGGIKACNAAGQCVAAPVQCEMPVFPQLRR